jgi:tRNA/rRNA methyltransferase/tRNA (cytidine32/uridine32-2'-O)-methyltransferase
MKNMGLSRLKLAAPQPLNAEAVLSRAVHAEEIWENARIFNDFPSAIADCSLVIGTTRRRGHHRKSISMDPRSLAVWLKERPCSETDVIAIVFGNERTGLEETELNLCNFASHIPACEAQPSLNLSHAVQIYAYELFLALEPALPVKGGWTALNQGEISALVGSITDTLAGLGFYRHPGREMQARFLHDLISRAGLSEREGRYFRDIIAKSARMRSIS